jgi:selenophosphate synthetase-related protein
LPLIAEQGLSCAAKDISNAGIIGTISIMLENSGKGGCIDLEAIPRPSEVALIDWLRCFQSFGFILSVKPEKSKEVQAIFSSRMISSRIIGKVSEEPIVKLKQEQEFIILFDFRKDEITGISYNGITGCS